MKGFEITEKDAGQRLDKALALFTGMGLRGARRLLKDGKILINSKATAPGSRLRCGDIITINDAGESTGLSPDYLGASGPYHFFLKPARMHTVALAGRNNESLEGFLPDLAKRHNLPEDLALLQRLDFGTAGLVCAASPDYAKVWREMEKAGEISKYYYGLFEGDIEEPLLIKNKIRTNGGKKVKVEAEEGGESGWTKIEPLWRGLAPDGDRVSIGRCIIKCGQRHQIRTHAAYGGHPLYGDALYGGKVQANFKLEHYRLEMADHSFCWDEAELGRILSEKANKGETEICI